MADDPPRRRQYLRIPRQPRPTAYELAPAPLNWQHRADGPNQQSRATDPWISAPIAWDNADDEMRQNATDQYIDEHRDSPRDSSPPPKYEDPFSDRFEDTSPVNAACPNSYEVNADLAFPIKEEPRDEVLETSDLDLPNRGYMDRSSPFELDSPRTDKSFMDWYPKGDATITFLNENGEIETLTEISPWMFEDRCPLLAQAFEPSRNGPVLFLEALTSATARPFLRFLYTGSYAVPGACGDVYEDVPTSVLLHCQLYRLGDIYDLPELKQQANVNITRQCEFGCSSPDKPIDLCAAIKFVYEHMSQHENLIDTIICYCVTCFLRHRLSEDFEFRTMAYNLRPFHQDLCKESMKREFEDDTATAIIQMPFEPYVPDTYASREDVDCVFHFHGLDEPEPSPKKRKRPEMVLTGPAISGISLALRQRQSGQSAVQIAVDETESEEEDLYTGSKRRLSAISDSKDRLAVYTSDSEYEVVAGPASVHELSSDSESDSDPPVLLQHSVTEHKQQELPIRGRNNASSARLVDGGPFNDAASDSESDWTLV